MGYWLLNSCKLRLQEAAIYKKPLKGYTGILPPGNMTQNYQVRPKIPKVGPRTYEDQNLLKTHN